MEMFDSVYVHAEKLKKNNVNILCVTLSYCTIAQILTSIYQFTSVSKIS